MVLIISFQTAASRLLASLTAVASATACAATALAAAQAGFRVVVVDQLAAHTQVEQEFDGRSHAMALTSVRLLKALGLWADPYNGHRTAQTAISTAPNLYNPAHA